MTIGLLMLATFAVGFAMIAKRLAATPLTAPIAFIGFGYLMSHTGLFPQAWAEQSLHLVAEIALVLLLFLDAAQINLKALRDRHVWPVRMLVIGLPLAIGLGALVNWFLLPSWPLVAGALVAAILAPTDAALGQAVVTNSIVPERVRRALTVESGLNDGLALPLVLLFASLSAEVMGDTGTNWLLFGAMQLLLGPAAGAAIGSAGALVLLWAKRHNMTAEAFEGVGALALAALSYLAATQIGGNGFISAFAAGLAFGHVIKGQCKFVYEFTEGEGLMLTWGAFFLLGLALVPQAVQHLDGTSLAIILISLFIVRPAAIWVSLLGTDASNITKLFFGWFGPRGLATALFALLVVHKIDQQIAEPVLMLAVNAVWISALLHGVTANLGARWYAGKVAAMGECPETRPVSHSAKPIRTHPS